MSRKIERISKRSFELLCAALTGAVIQGLTPEEAARRAVDAAYETIDVVEEQIEFDQAVDG